MASNSESGFNFPAPKPRSSSERARLDAIARGRKRDRAQRENAFFGSISDLGEAGSLDQLEPTASGEPTNDAPLPELELDGIPDAFFEVAEREVSATGDPFELPSSTGEHSSPAFVGNSYPEEHSNGAGSRQEIEDIPSGFFKAADEPAPPADEEDARFDFDFDVPSVLGEQPETRPVPPPNLREPETEPVRTTPDDAPGHVAIPAMASNIIRPSADSSFGGPSSSGRPRASAVPTRAPMPMQEAARSGPPPIPEADPASLVLPRFPQRPPRYVEAVPRSLEASPTRRRTTPSEPHREVGRSPRPADGAPLAAIRRKMSGSHQALAPDEELVPFAEAPIESARPEAPMADEATRRTATEAPAFDEFDYAKGSGRIAVVGGTHAGRKVIDVEAVDFDDAANDPVTERLDADAGGALQAGASDETETTARRTRMEVSDHDRDAVAIPAAAATFRSADSGNAQTEPIQPIGETDPRQVVAAAPTTESVEMTTGPAIEDEIIEDAVDEGATAEAIADEIGATETDAAEACEPLASPPAEDSASTWKPTTTRKRFRRIGPGARA